MSKSHTPGPWRYHDELILAGGNVGTRHGKIIAESSDCFHFDTEPEREANARLIAAAPELLEACKEAFDNWEPATAGLLTKKLALVIKKATGETP